MLRKAEVCNEVFQFSIEGFVTGCMVNELREAILPIIYRSEEIEIDLSRVARIDLSGLLLMVDIKLMALAQGKTLRIIRYNQPVIEILEFSGLTDFFDAPERLYSMGSTDAP